MLEYIKQQANKTYTENGAAAYESTGSYCLDLFSTVGAIREKSERNIIDRFIRAFYEDRDYAMKILFFARDIRGGLGERRVFRIILKWLAQNEPQSVRKNIQYIAEYGRFDDLLTLFDTPCEDDMLDIIKAQLRTDTLALENAENVSLLAKWLPSINTSNATSRQYAKRIANAIGLSLADYRKTLSRLRAQIKIIENNLRQKDYTFDYSKQPSRAMFKYRAAFYRNDAERYMAFLSDVCSGKATLHADNVAPYELVLPYFDFDFTTDSFIRNMNDEEKQTLNATWAALDDYCSDENAIAVVDTSGSMYWNGGIPAAVALSLGLYFAEHNTGRFKNCFIEFSAHPKLIEIKGDSFADKLRYIGSFCEVANTNLQAVFDLILNAAVEHDVPQSEMPKKLYIISDMEFDCCINDASSTVFENARQFYAKHGYTLPQIVFWNVDSRNLQQPVMQNELGVALISGVTPKIFDMVISGTLSPYSFMVEVLNRERYAKITA